MCQHLLTYTFELIQYNVYFSLIKCLLMMFPVYKTFWSAGIYQFFQNQGQIFKNLLKISLKILMRAHIIAFCRDFVCSKTFDFRFGVKYRQSCLIDNIWSGIIQLILIHITLNHLSTHLCSIKISSNVP